MVKTDIKDQDLENKDVTAGDEGVDDTCSDTSPLSSEDKCDNMSDTDTGCGDNESSLSNQIKDCQDKYIRLQADFDNYRKRTLKEKMELIDTASVGIVKSVLTVVDDMDRAVQASKLTDNVDSLRQGLELISVKLYDVLKQNNVKEIPSMNEDFNTDYHDAVAKIPVEKEEAKGKIIDVIEKGYTMKDKIIRFSKVVVGE